MKQTPNTNNQICPQLSIQSLLSNIFSAIRHYEETKGREPKYIYLSSGQIHKLKTEIGINYPPCSETGEDIHRMIVFGLTIRPVSETKITLSN